MMSRHHVIPLLTAASIIAGPCFANANLNGLPAKVARKCHTPIEWLSVQQPDEVHLQPTPDADFSKVDCVLGYVTKLTGLKLGFVGNEADPNQPLNPPWSYIAGGRVEVLDNLAREAQSAGWVVGTFAKAADGTGFLLFQTPPGMTVAQATPFADRLWNHQLGDVTFGPAPTRNGSGFEDR
jgi:hypothetical protein